MNEITYQTLKKAWLERRAYTFSDITLADVPSNLIPSDCNLETQVTSNYRLKTPFISAAMDTVTEGQMASTMAKNGGLGVIHRNLGIQEQTDQVEWVRRQVHYGGKIIEPVSFDEKVTVAELQQKVIANGWSFTSFPITKDGKLVGLVTKDELGFVHNDNPTLDSIMKPLDQLVTAPNNMNAQEAFELMSSRRVKKLPLLDTSGRLSGMYVWADVRRNVETQSLFSLDKDGRLLVAAAVGPGPAERERIDALVKVGCPIIVVDCSHGACKAVVEQIKYIRSVAPFVDIIAGNIASCSAARYLLENAKPDAIKCGIGPGSICTTRRVTGHGVPQITAIFDVWRALSDKYNIPIIADGGITCSGDIVKALAVGANCVMLGSMLAGTDESPGEIVTQQNKKYKSYRGMGSRSAMAERSGSRTRYSQGNTGTELLTSRQQAKITPEGIEGFVEYRGTVVLILKELSGGIQSGLAHSNANTIQELRGNAQLWVQTSAGYIEGNPHNVIERV